MGLMKCLPFLTLVVLLMNSENKVNGENAAPDPRKIPLCISDADPVLQKNTKFTEFIPIIRGLKDTDQYFNKDSPILTGTTDPAHKILDTIEFSRIRLAVGRIAGGRTLPKVFKTKPLGTSNEFHQWVHIKVKAKVDLKGIIVGAMHGPLGLPIGSFTGFMSYDQRCSCFSGTSEVANFLAIPCTFKSRASLTHPDVFVWHNEYALPVENVAKGFTAKTTGPMKEIHMNFNFIDVKCHRAAILQFYVIGIQEFGTTPSAEALVTPVFSRPTPSSIDGSPYPFHSDFCQAIDCGEDAATMNPAEFLFTPPNVFDFTSTREMRYNIEYDLCIKNSKPKPGDPSVSCPPGPFKCNDPNPFMITSTTDPNDPKTLANIQMNIADEATRVEASSTDPACNCPVKLNASGGGGLKVRNLDMINVSPWMDTLLTELQRGDEIVPTEKPDLGMVAKIPEFDTLDTTLRKNIEAQRTLTVKTDRLRIIHGCLMFFAFSICGSISVFIARFDKDLMPGVGCCGRGVWLWAHILLAFFSIMCMWGGIWIIIPTVKAKWDEEKHSHGVIGGIGMFLFHFTFFSGWIRPVGRTYRGVFISIHAIVGYTSKLFGAIPMFLIDHGRIFAIIMVLAAEIVNLLFYGANTVVQCLTDSHMEMRAPRKVCPFLEHKELPGPVPATCNMTRNLVMILHAASLILIFILATTLWPTEFGLLRSYYDILLPGHWGEEKAGKAAGISNITV